MPDIVVARTGETPDMLTFRIWGDETLCHHLLAANPERIGTLRFAGGEILIVPDLPPGRTEEVPPPWRV